MANRGEGKLNWYAREFNTSPICCYYPG